MGFTDEDADRDDGMVTRPDATHLTEHERNALKEKYEDAPRTSDLGDETRDQMHDADRVVHH